MSFADLILHAGMPKTGTSSIQESLFSGLRDPRFHYLGLGMVNGSRPIQCLVGDTAVAPHVHQAQGVNLKEMESRRPFFHGCWKRQIQRARRAQATPIISAEDCWMMNQGELGRLRDMIEAEGYRAQVIVYVRPPLEWLSSMFQEMVKSGHHSFVDTLLLASQESSSRNPSLPCDYRRRLGNLAEAFGANRLLVRPFDKDHMASGCVVTDFRNTLGIQLATRSIRRVNDSLSLDAVRFLYAYNRFARQQHPIPSWRFLLLLKRLQELPGKPLRLHPQLLEVVVPTWKDQQQDLLDSYRIQFNEQWNPADPALIRQEQDMLEYSGTSLDWLQAVSGRMISKEKNLPEQVARLVGAIRLHPIERWRALYQGKRRQMRIHYANR
jgi:hypothetical protein